MPSWEEYVNAYKAQQHQKHQDKIYNNIKFEPGQN
jgi:hypothetical protein